ncbi:DUF5994 family protein [Lentzea sp. NPDC005914]|uniref:DUF5994 family protein n=1 Tax=Lentzea sp. NPDC005914 TaxID=3154572 RepID=UPI0033C800CD
MTSAPHHSITPLAVTATEQPRCPLRSRLRPQALTTGYVDGAWWPPSRDLAAELPAPLAVPAVRLGEIPRATGFWTRPPHTADVVAGQQTNRGVR